MLDNIKLIAIIAGIVLLLYLINLFMPPSRLNKSKMGREIHRKQEHYRK